MTLRKRGHWLPVFFLLTASGCGTDVFMPITGTVYGTLVLESGAPAAGAILSAEDTGLSAVADEAGRFQLPGLASVDESGIGRSYNLRARHDQGDQRVGAVLVEFKVKEQQSYSIGRLVLKPVGSIRGTVRVAGDGDASGCRVRVDGFELEAITRADGGFEVSEVPAFDAYTLVCERIGSDPVRIGGITVAPGAETEVGEIVLAPAGVARR